MSDVGRSLKRLAKALGHSPTAADPIRDPFDPAGIGELEPNFGPRPAPLATNQAFHRGRRLMLLGGLALGVAYTPDPTEHELDFYTDFTERDPTRYWRTSPLAGLQIEKHEDRMSAVPSGTPLVAPSAGMRDGRAVFHFASGLQPASFVFRTQEDAAYGYIATCSKRLDRGQPQMVLAIDKRSPRGIVRMKEVVIKDFYLSSQQRQRLWLEMDGPDFTARLERAVPGNRFALFESEPESQVVHTWKDPSYRDGLIGLRGRGANLYADKFRVFSVSVEA